MRTYRWDQWSAAPVALALALLFIGGCGDVDHSKPAVVVSFEVEPDSIRTGETATLTWVTQDATEVVIEPGIGAVAASGSREVTPAETITFTLTASNAAGTDSAQISVEVIPPEQPVVEVFTVSPAQIQIGETASLQWTVSGADSVVIEPAIGEVALEDTQRVAPLVTTTYTLTASNAAGDTTAQVFLRVYAADSPVALFAAGRDHTLLAAPTGRLISWGRNDYGQVGDGTDVEHITAEPVDLP